MHRLGRFKALAAAGIAVFSVFLGSAPARAEPGLWVARGPHATVYLFGTVHLLRKDQAWETPAVAHALAASYELWLEVPNVDDAKAARTLTTQLGFDRDHPLSTKLPSQDLARLDAAARSVGISDGEKMLEPMRPWLASVVLDDAFAAHAGYDAGSGVDRQLSVEAKAAGKTVRGFETLDQQIHFFADLTPPLELNLLESTLRDFDKGAAMLEALERAWTDGDDAAISRLMVDDLKKPTPELYQVILVDRNESFAKAIAVMVEGSGVHFVAVGAAHLAGSDSLQTKLAARGIQVERVLPSR